MVRLPALRGAVFVREAGQFYGQNETLNPEPTEQLPQFLPRVDWPRRSQAHGQYYDPDTAPLERIELRALMNNQGQINARAEWDKDNPDLSPMPPYMHEIDTVSYMPCYNELSIWQDHAVILHNLLTVTLANKNWLSDDEMTELLTCASYGMHQSMTWLHNWVFEWLDRSQGAEDEVSKGSPFHKERNSDFGIDMVTSNVESRFFPDNDQRNSTLRYIRGRRWIAVPINQFQHHWYMTLFDRQEGQLYIFDAMKTNRKDRIEAAVHMWAKFWNNMGMPWHFQYFVAPVEEQYENWECGIISVAWIIAALRNRVGGSRILVADASLPPEDYILGTHRPNGYSYQDSSIALPDWLPIGCKFGHTGVKAVRRMFEVLIANELGMKDHEVMKVEERQPSGTKSAKKTAWKRIYSVCRLWEKKKEETKNQAGTSTKQSPKDAQDTTDDMILPIKDFYTGVGGLQFSWPTTHPPKKYSAKVERTFYRVPKCPGKIDFSPSRLAAKPTQEYDKIQYARKPLRDPTQTSSAQAGTTQAAPIQAAPTQAAPAPTQAAPVQAASVQAAPTQAAPAPTQAAPAPTQAAPTLAAPIQAAPAPTQAGPTQAMPPQQQGAPQQQGVPQQAPSQQNANGTSGSSTGSKRGRDKDHDRTESDARQAKRLRKDTKFWRNMNKKGPK